MNFTLIFLNEGKNQHLKMKTYKSWKSVPLGKLHYKKIKEVIQAERKWYQMEIGIYENELKSTRYGKYYMGK